MRDFLRNLHGRSRRTTMPPPAHPPHPPPPSSRSLSPTPRRGNCTETDHDGDNIGACCRSASAVIAPCCIARKVATVHPLRDASGCDLEEGGRKRHSASILSAEEKQKEKEEHENVLVTDRHCFFYPTVQSIDEHRDEREFLLRHFCGTTWTSFEDVQVEIERWATSDIDWKTHNTCKTHWYVGGHLQRNLPWLRRQLFAANELARTHRQRQRKNHHPSVVSANAEEKEGGGGGSGGGGGGIDEQVPAWTIVFIHELSHSSTYDLERQFGGVHVGEVPINVQNAGVLFRRMFHPALGSLQQTLLSQHWMQPFTRLGASAIATATANATSPSTSVCAGAVALSDVVEVNIGTRAHEHRFHVLRGSYSFGGPTNEFSDVDRMIVARVNEAIAHCFADPAPVNHGVMELCVHSISASTFTSAANPTQLTDSIIRQRAEKTLDLAPNGVIAFCSFYDCSPYPGGSGRSALPFGNLPFSSMQSSTTMTPVETHIPFSTKHDSTKDTTTTSTPPDMHLQSPSSQTSRTSSSSATSSDSDAFLHTLRTWSSSANMSSKHPPPHQYDPSPHDVFDLQHRGISVLTRLRFRLKRDIADTCTRPREFDVVLYPNSVFLMPLSTNRLYTHEVVPSVFPPEVLPVRLAYTLRCSNRVAVHRGGRTYFAHSSDGIGEMVPMEDVQEQSAAVLQQLFAEENLTSRRIRYNEDDAVWNFSFSRGDYMRPLIHIRVPHV